MIELKEKEDVCLISITESLDTRQSRELDAMLNRLLAEKKKFYVFDMSEMHFLSTSGIQILLKTLRAVKDLAGDMALCRLNSVVKKALRILSLDDVFTIAETADEGIAKLVRK